MGKTSVGEQVRPTIAKMNAHWASGLSAELPPESAHALARLLSALAGRVDRAEEAQAAWMAELAAEHERLERRGWDMARAGFALGVAFGGALALIATAGP